MPRIRARKRYGQHYLVDSSIAERMAGMVEADPGQVILEVGPGTGALTAPLIARHGRLVAVEIDRDLVCRLRQRFEPAQLCLINADILQVDLKQLELHERSAGLVVVGNLPYNITAPLLFRLLDHRQIIHRAVVMVQYEVAERLVAPPGNRRYGQITVLLGAYARIRILMEVGASAFRPVPKVRSAVVECMFEKQPRYPIQDEKTFRRVVRTAFGQRRKMLRNSLTGMLPSDQRECLPEIARRAGITLTQRPEQLGVEQFARLADEFVAFVQGQAQSSAP